MKKTIALSMLLAGCHGAPDVSESVGEAEAALDLPGTPFQNMNGARYRHSYLTTADGFRQASSIHDTYFEQDVMWRIAIDGELRMFPVASDGNSYLDPWCTVNVYVHQSYAAQCGYVAQVPGYVTSQRNDFQGGCLVTEGAEAWEVGSAIVPTPTVYTYGSGTCVIKSPPQGTLFTVYEVTEVPMSMLMKVSVTYPVVVW